jgi:hypothetical protein
MECTCCKQSANTHAVTNHLVNASAASNLSMECMCCKQSANPHALSNHLSMHVLQAICQSTRCKLSSVNAPAIASVNAPDASYYQFTCCTKSANAPALSNMSMHPIQAIRQITCGKLSEVICQYTCCK